MFQGVDYFKISDLFSDDERMIQQTVREFVEERFMPVIQKHHRNGTFPLDIIPEMGQMGLLGVTVPEEYGGPGLSNFIYGIAMQELERGDSGLRSFASVQGSLVMFPIKTYGSEEQKKKWLPLLASGTKIGCFGLTEPDFGSNPGGMLTRAKKTNDGWLINGSKMWITNGSLADIAVVWAKTDDGINGFLLEKGTPGFTAKGLEGKLSLRASDTAELSFQDCFVPDENKLPGALGLKGPLSCLNEARYGISWGVTGAAMACYDEALNYSKNRIQFDKPIASFQLTQEKLVAMVTEITKSQLLNYQLGRLKDKGLATFNHVSLAKRNNVAQALNIARTARTILGANGISDEYQSMRHAMNLESVLTYEGTHEVHTLIVGQHITGESAF
ncbi:MAG: acyl-CoA dehydrogenase family protein [Calditrichae bacterium]|nr:acyl-CoA dehydrogenase family protein [Calditrichota bacterium]MCB9058085.1 acyl-CoA dehydrogenase family protein [Calditrichia bacterium]